MDFGRDIRCQQDRIRKKVAECGWKGKAVHVIYEQRIFRQSDTSSATVAQRALDMYVDMMVAGSAAAESVVAGSASTSGGVRWCQYVGGLGGAAHCPGSPSVIMSCLLVKHSQHAIMIKEPQHRSSSLSTTPPSACCTSRQTLSQKSLAGLLQQTIQISMKR